MKGNRVQMLCYAGIESLGSVPSVGFYTCTSHLDDHAGCCQYVEGKKCQLVRAVEGRTNLDRGTYDLVQFAAQAEEIGQGTLKPYLHRHLDVPRVIL